MTPILEHLETALRQATDIDLRAELRARRAGVLARLGRFDEARGEIVDLRRVFNDGRSAAATSWIMLTEGIVHYYGEFNPEGVDRVKRAQFLSIATGNRRLIAVSSAWKAHLEFEGSKYESMIDSLMLAVEHVSQSDFDALTRISIVVCNAYLACGDRIGAQPWFMRGRESALRDGDRSSIEALMYNRATMSLALARVDFCLGVPLTIDLATLRQELNSTRNFEDIVGRTTLLEHVAYWNARLLILEGHFEEAFVALKKIDRSAKFPVTSFSPTLLDIEFAYCQFKIGAIETAAVLCASADVGSLGQLELDESLFADRMLWEMSRGRTDFKDEHEIRTSMLEKSQLLLSARNRLKSGLIELENYLYKNSIPILKSD